ncbi:hypothetical protein D3C85_1486980 [compost metagenome]
MVPASRDATFSSAYAALKKGQCARINQAGIEAVPRFRQSLVAMRVSHGSLVSARGIDSVDALARADYYACEKKTEDDMRVCHCEPGFHAAHSSER